MARQMSLDERTELRCALERLPQPPTERFSAALVRVYSDRLAVLSPGEVFRPSDLKGLELDVSFDLTKEKTLRAFWERCCFYFRGVGVLDDAGRRAR